jgi:multimeric flavodoxin WrbA
MHPVIIGISASPRLNGTTANAVRQVLAESGEEHEFISLSGKKIGGCISCLGCVKDNHCVVHDDFPPIAQKLVDADALVFGAPDYYGLPNGLAHSFWERCFCFRHNENFLLAGKPVVLIATAYKKGTSVLEILERFATSNKMDVVDRFAVGGYSQCYTCPSGTTCMIGNVTKDHGIVDSLTLDMLPPTFCEQPEAVQDAKEAGAILSRAIKRQA